MDRWMKNVVFLMMMISMVGFTNGSLHYVGGGKTTWAPNVNLTDWASHHEHFYVGDWLYFGFDKHSYSVLEVNRTSYENCISTDFLKNVTRGGRDVFQMIEAKTYYFIDGRGFCFQGLKVAIDCETSAPTPSPAPAPAPAKNAAPSLFGSLDALSWIFCLSLVF
ncbi:lamin-like protein-like [Tripterygium wilfordii]|uniref:Lamin-like protein-like n=1 Tax=Tripterygium wilfordii TaxID=458696 RepID=A0A7J7DF06_TRIWF|nr:lamin-like protein [Tripterygium wilfordii]KAF5744975.1 lamin-like protein-like [Tripterygium wilfordii]